MPNSRVAVGGWRAGIVPFAIAFGCLLTPASAQETPDSLARELSNPLAALTIVPFQFNADFGSGSNGKGQSYRLDFQPVIPFHPSPGLNIVSRTILPLAGLVDVSKKDVWGIGDTTQSLFLSPSQLGPGGLIWGVGPIMLLPTGTDESLGSGKWGAGPTAVVLARSERLTTGALVHQLWSFAGDDDRGDINRTFLQPFAAYSLGGGQTLRIDMPTTFNWVSSQWTVPVNVGYTRVFFAGKQAMSITGGVRYYLEGPENGPKWGLRTGLTFLFPSR